jgi:hypothetical protein
MILIQTSFLKHTFENLSIKSIISLILIITVVKIELLKNLIILIGSKLIH